MVAKHISISEAQTLLARLKTFIAQGTTYYGADPAEARDAAASLADLETWLEELAGRRRIQT